jgi:pseudaminic acid synthase
MIASDEKSLSINDRQIGSAHPPYIIAEMSGNHNGNIERAFRIMEEAKAAGADAVKLQTYTADTITIDHDGPGFVIEGGLWDGAKLYDLYKTASTPWEWHEALFAKGRELDITVFSSPFDATAVDFLEDLEAPAYKIASFEVTDIPLIEKTASTGKPIIISSGMATIEELHEAVDAAQRAGSGEIILLHCVSAYPTPPHESNLLRLQDIVAEFSVVTGLSDHSVGTTVAVTAVALGAAVVEKHFTLARADGGPDAAFSLEPSEMAQLCQDCRISWDALRRPKFGAAKLENEMKSLRRSIYVVEDIAVGETFNLKNIRCIRPGHGLTPKHFSGILGRKAAQNLRRGTPLGWDYILDE